MARPGAASSALAALVVALTSCSASTPASDAARTARLAVAAPVTAPLPGVGPHRTAAYQAALDGVYRKLRRTAVTSPSGGWPSSAQPGAAAWTRITTLTWEEGFFPAQLWLAYGDSNRNHDWGVWARRWSTGLAPAAATQWIHDFGFIVEVPLARAYALTADDSYRRLVLQAAASLATHHDPVAHILWSRHDGDVHQAIVDSLMNMDVMFWAAAHGGPAVYRDYALEHARTLARLLVRPDGSTFHIVEFDPQTGAPTRRFTGQGYADDSTWSRGQAWALTGFTDIYRRTHDPEILAAAVATASYFVRHLPADGVPPWDFAVPSAGRDSSAGAIAVDGLLSLTDLDPDRARANRWRAYALHVLDGLTSPAYLQPPAAGVASLLKGTPGVKGSLHQPQVSLIWGDYYLHLDLLRALGRVR